MKQLTKEQAIKFYENKFNMAGEIYDNVSHNITPSKEKLIVQEIINQIYRAL